MKKGSKQSEETKRKISETMKNKYRGGPNVGKKFSDETRQKMREAKLGVPKSPAHREAMRKAHLGEKHTDERNANQSIGMIISHAIKKLNMEIEND